MQHILLSNFFFFLISTHCSRYYTIGGEQKHTRSLLTWCLMLEDKMNNKQLDKKRQFLIAVSAM